MNNPIHLEWFKPMPNGEEGYMMNSEGVLLTAFHLLAIDPNQKSRAFVNKVLAFATQRGYEHSKSLKAGLSNPDIEVDDLVSHVVEIYPFLGTKTVQQLLNG